MLKSLNWTYRMEAYFIENALFGGSKMLRVKGLYLACGSTDFPTYDWVSR